MDMAVIMIQQTFIDYRKIDHKIFDIQNKISEMRIEMFKLAIQGFEQGRELYNIEQVKFASKGRTPEYKDDKGNVKKFACVKVENGEFLLKYNNKKDEWYRWGDYRWIDDNIVTPKHILLHNILDAIEKEVDWFEEYGWGTASIK